MTKAMKALRKLYDGYCQAADEFGGEYPHADHNLVKQALEENIKLKAEIELINDNYGKLRQETNKEFDKLEAQLADKEALLGRKRLWEILYELHRDLNFCYNPKQANRMYDKAIAAIKENEDK